MLTASTPLTLLSEQVARLTDQLEAVRDGGSESIHDARVTTRRLRELLELMQTDAEDELRLRVKRAGQALGRVRDVDVRIELLTRLESRLPPMAPALLTLRHSASRTRPGLLRRTIKRLESLDLGSTRVDRLDHVRRRRSGQNGWHLAIRRALAHRARAAQEAIDHATGVYFPNRVHAVRIALKQMRYAMEIADATRIANLSAPVRDVRKAQDVLGDIHDRQTLLEDLVDSGEEAEIPRSALDGIAQVVEADIQRLHERYLGKRTHLREISTGVARIRTDRWSTLPMMPAAATAAVAVASGLYLVHRPASVG